MEAGRQTWKPSSRQALADYTGMVMYGDVWWCMVMYGVWDSPNLYLRTPSELDSQWFLTPGAFGPGTNDANGDEDAPKAFLADVFLAGLSSLEAKRSLQSSSV